MRYRCSDNNDFNRIIRVLDYVIIAVEHLRKDASERTRISSSERAVERRTGSEAKAIGCAQGSKHFVHGRAARVQSDRIQRSFKARFSARDTRQHRSEGGKKDHSPHPVEEGFQKPVRYLVHAWSLSAFGFQRYSP